MKTNALTIKLGKNFTLSLPFIRIPAGEGVASSATTIGNATTLDYNCGSLEPGDTVHVPLEDPATSNPMQFNPDERETQISQIIRFYIDKSLTRATDYITIHLEEDFDLSLTPGVNIIFGAAGSGATVTSIDKVDGRTYRLNLSGVVLQKTVSVSIRDVPFTDFFNCVSQVQIVQRIVDWRWFYIGPAGGTSKKLVWVDGPGYGTDTAYEDVFPDPSVYTGPIDYNQLIGWFDFSDMPWGKGGLNHA